VPTVLVAFAVLHILLTDSAPNGVLDVVGQQLLVYRLFDEVPVD